MKKLHVLKNQRGVSLVEVLGVVVILSFIGIILFSIVASGQKQYSNQSEKNQELQGISYALKVITKEIRQYPGTILVDSSLNQLTINGTLYEQNDTNLMRNSTVFIRNIDVFDVHENSGTIEIKLKSSSGEEVSTQIVER